MPPATGVAASSCVTVSLTAFACISFRVPEKGIVIDAPFEARHFSGTPNRCIP